MEEALVTTVPRTKTYRLLTLHKAKVHVQQTFQTAARQKNAPLLTTDISGSNLGTEEDDLNRLSVVFLSSFRQVLGH